MGYTLQMKNLCKISFISIIFFLLSSSTRYDHLTVSPDFVFYANAKSKENKGLIFEHNMITGHKELLPIQGGFVSLDHSGEKMGIMTFLKIPDRQESRFVLKIYDRQSRSLLVSFKDAGYFAFSPDGQKIAILNDYPERFDGPEPPGFEEGVWVYDFITKSKQKIVDNAYDINWPEFDGNLYILSGNSVSIFDFKTRKMKATSYKGIYFSWDGQYYADHYDNEGPFWTLYRSSDNSEMKEWMNEIWNKEQNPNGFTNFEFWCKKLNAAVFNTNNFENVIFDLKQGKIIGKFSGDILGINYDATLISINKPDSNCDKGKNLICPSKLEIIDLLDWTAKNRKGK